MDVTNFYTMQAPREEYKADRSEKSDSSVHNAPGKSFLDFIMARIAEADAKKDEQTLLSSDNPVLDPNLDSSDILGLNKDMREEIKSLLFGEDDLSKTLLMNQKALDAALAPATDGIITSANVEAGSPQLLQSLMIGGNAVDGSAAMAKLKAILAKLEQLEANGGLAVTNLTPAEITDLKAKIDAMLKAQAALSEEEKRKALEGIYLGLIKLISPAEQSSASIQAAIDKKQAEMNAHLNNLARKTEGPKAPWSDLPVEETSKGNEFSNMLKDFSGKKNIAADLSVKTPGVKADLSALQGWPFNVNSSLFTPMQWSQVPFDEFAAHAPALNVTSLGSLTNLVTQAHSAAHPHPAMQVVAATISKAAVTGESKNITLQLDPPELGRVEVRLNFGKDKTVKAVVVTEKPETHMMLQRDAHLLERALFDSGLDAGGSDLSFELADSGYNFDGNDGGSRGGRGGGADNAPDEIIETTMTWQVDPETGHMRYSLLV
jgi:flagellar hook-length control protein FliK